MSTLATDQHWLWRQRVEQALTDTRPVPATELLLVRDQHGRAFRPVAPPPGITARIGAVLLLLYPDGLDTRLPLTVRSHQLANHRGEVSLPGGATDPQDGSAAVTALRECEEELGIPAIHIEVLGTLSPIYIQPSNFAITPVVGWINSHPTIHFNDAEVSSVISITLQELIDPQTRREEAWDLRGRQAHVQYFAIAGEKVWGATAMILSEFAARLHRTISC